MLGSLHRQTFRALRPTCRGLVHIIHIIRRQEVAVLPTLKQSWPWNRNFQRLFFLVPSLVGLLLTLFYYSTGGVYSLWFLTGIPIGLVLWRIYHAVGNRVEALLASYREDDGEVIEGLLVLGRLQSPGLAILREQELELAPIVGHKVIVPLEQVRIQKEGRMLPGKFVWGKRAFILQPVHLQRLAFAVEESVGRRWSRYFNRSEGQLSGRAAK